MIDIDELKEKAENGDAVAQFNLGLCYYKGMYGVKQDYTKTVYWQTKAAEQGIAEAQVNLGYSYYIGLGVKQCDETAVYWYTLAALQNNVRAQYNLGLCYKLGEGVPKDHDKSIEWFAKASIQGSEEAIAKLIEYSAQKNRKAADCLEKISVNNYLGKNVKILRTSSWIHYVSERSPLNRDKVGKWMYFFNDIQIVADLCFSAVANKIVSAAKHSNAQDGVACFYIEGDDTAAHKRVLSFFLEKNLIRKTKAGRLYDISFKYDNQTRAGEYGSDFKSEIKLSKYVDLISGKWLI